MSKKSLLKGNCANVSTPSRENVVKINSEVKPVDFPTICESESGLDSLAPDKLVNIIVKEKTHPMAKLLIGNMIGLNNEESEIVTAYQTLTTIINQDNSSKSKEYKLKNKFYINNKSHKNILKQRREIANLAIDAKFETITKATTRSGRLRSIKKRLSKAEVVPQRKMINVPRIQSNNFTIHKSEKETRKIVGKNRPQLRETSTQCELLKPTCVNKETQTERICDIETIDENDMKIELIEMDVVKEEPEDIESDNEIVPFYNSSLTRGTYSSAFAAVRTSNVDCRIALLRSIGFKPIDINSPVNQESNRPQADEEYNKYTNEESEDVSYMNVSLHHEDLEEEITQEMLHTMPQPLTSLTEADFNREWHGWQKVHIDGKDYWSGY